MKLDTRMQFTKASQSTRKRLDGDGRKDAQAQPVPQSCDERLQAFEGVVIARKRGAQPSFTVRKISFGQGVERIFPIDSKVIDKIDVVRSAKVRRAKLYYLRELKGKAARLKEVEQQ